MRQFLIGIYTPIFHFFVQIFAILPSGSSDTQNSLKLGLAYSFWKKNSRTLWRKKTKYGVSQCTNIANVWKFHSLAFSTLLVTTQPAWTDYTCASKCYITVFDFFRSAHSSHFCIHLILICLDFVYAFWLSCTNLFIRSRAFAKICSQGPFLPSTLVLNKKGINSYSRSYLLHFYINAN